MPAAEQEDFVTAIAQGGTPASLGAADVELLAYARKLTRTPADVDARDVERLRAVGFDDLAIHDLCAICAYFAFVNRIADGLGVDLEG